MEMVMEDVIAEGVAAEGSTLIGLAERLAAVAASLENVIAGWMERQGSVAASAETGGERIVATVESGREAELERRLAAADAEIATLRAGSFAPDMVTNSLRGSQGRRTLPTSMASLLAKQGVAVDSVSMEAGALDTALNSLSIEQRIAVKAQLMRAGLLG